ncbi:MAG: DNA primase [Bacteroidetes bacterium]|nr:MAG: DNA primase [Bacteroidota bacterium]
MISQNTIQQILSRIDITEIIGGFVKLKKRGANYLGLCPFHNEKTPSFTVSPSKEIYKCFGCGRSGNTISFLMEHEKYSYVEALKWLAQKYNVEVEETESSPEVKAMQQAADSLYIINGFAQKYFAEQLFSSDEGQNIALSYLKERGFREETIKKFQLGYGLEERDAFAKVALAAQYNQDLLQKSGLVVVRDGRISDNYRGRIIFPVHNQTGKIQGFGARLIRNNDRAPKYINTPENEIYVKSRILYGMYFARQAIDKMDECLLVEGYTDVISLHQAGIENVVASGGTSLTHDQLRLIRKYTKHLTIIYDGDQAGVKAALRGLDMALEEGLSVKLVLIPDNDDPDSYVNKIGASAFREFIATSRKDFILFQIELALRDAGADSNKKAILVNQIAETISKINKAEDFTLQQDYIRKSAELLKIDEAGLLGLVNKFIRDRVGKFETKAGMVEPSASGPDSEQAIPENEDELFNLLFRDEMQERAIIRSLLEFGMKPWEERKVADYMLEELGDHEMIDNTDLNKILDIYKNWYGQGFEPTAKNFLYQEDQHLSTMVVSIMDFPYELSPNWKEHYEGKILTREDLYKEEVISTISYLKLRKIKRLMEMNQKDLEKSHTPEEQVMYIETHKHLKNMEKELLAQVGTVIVK